jgi:transcriptional regulator with XRE-family HTH domain
MHDAIETGITPGHLIRICRADRRWSQQALADRVGCARTTIVRIENGSQPSPSTVRRLAEVLDLDVELLLPPEKTTAPPEGEAEATTHT